MKQPGNNTRNTGSPYSAVVTSFAAATNVTTLCPNAQNACDGFVVIVGAAGAGNLVWKDCAGTTSTLALANNANVWLPIALQSIEISTITGSVVLFWHPSNGGV